MQGSSSQHPDRFIVEASSFPMGESHSYDSRSVHSHESLPRRRRKRRIGYSFRYPFASARTQPFLTGFLFLFTILIGFTWWIAQPSVWEVEAAIIIAPPKTDDFLRSVLNSARSDIQYQDNSTISSTISRGLAAQGFRSLSPHDVGELLTTPALVRKARKQLLILHGRDQRGSTEEQDTSSPLEMLAARAVGFHDSTRQRITTIFRSVIGDIVSDDENQNSDTAFATKDDSSTEMNEFLAVNLVSSSPNEDHVLRMRITAGRPFLAEGAADMLVQLAKDRLSQFDSENSLQHLRDLQPKSEEAKVVLTDAQQQLDQYLNSLRTPEPIKEVSALALQLSTSENSKAQLETQTTEAEAERLAVMNQLNEMKRNGDAFVTIQKTAENPRILDVKREISELQSKHDSLVDFTEEHPEKKSLREQIIRKKHELAAIPPTIVVEDIRESNPVYEALDQRRLGLDRKISQLAGREVGIDNEIMTTRTNLESVRIQAKALATLENARDSAELSYHAIHNKVVYLLTKVSQSRQFQHIQLMETPRVSHANMPDQPNILIFLFGTLGVSLLVSLLGPSVRSQIRSRIITKEQVEALAFEIPIVIIGEIPNQPMRKLLPTR